MRSPLFRAAASAALLILPGLLLPPGASRLAAQQSPAVVPLDLAAAFARATPGADTGARVDFTPDQIPPALRDRALLPAGTHVIGAVTIGRTATVLASSTLPADSVLAWVSTAYGRAGFEALSRALGGAPSGGFRAAEPRAFTQFCKDTSDVNVSVATSGDGFTDVRIRITAPSLICGRLSPLARIATQRAAPPQSTLPLPLLHDPAGASFQPECYANASSQGTSTRLLTPMDPTALLRHYGAQLESQGWSPAPATAAMAQGSWTRRDSAGVSQVVTLRITIPPLAPTCREAAMDVSTLRGR